MKKIITPLLLLLFFAKYSVAQTNVIRPKSLSVSFILNDFATPERIRNSSLGTVLREKKVEELKNMGLGFGLTYIQGISTHVDFAATLGGSFATVSLPNKSNNQDRFLLEADASGNFKMLPEQATINPYLIAGIGASKYGSTYGAFIPVGGGVKANLFNETQFSLQLQYRIPVVTEANNYHFQISFGISGLL